MHRAWLTLLLGDSAAVARDALLSWTLAYGRLTVQTAGRQQELAAGRGTAPGSCQPGWAARAEPPILAKEIVSRSQAR